MKGLIISADDYGYGAGYDRGILEAAGAGALDAVSVMVRRERLAPEPLLATGVELGLHLELPAGEEADAEETGRETARNELVEQLGAFKRVFGRPAAFLDGHHHCHARPGLAGVIAGLAAERGLVVRSVDEPHRRLLRRLGVPTPGLLIGRIAENEPALPVELEAVMNGDPTPGGVVEWMVHPGHPDPSTGSAYDAGREQDLRLLGELLGSGPLLRLRAGHRVALGA